LTVPHKGAEARRNGADLQRDTRKASPSDPTSGFGCCLGFDANSPKPGVWIASALLQLMHVCEISIVAEG
jgi:hypothetical protein